MLVAVATGCYQGTQRTVSLRDVAREPGWVVVEGVPLVRQQAEHDCGPAALAMVLERWGIANVRGDVRRELEPGEHGAAAGALRDFARRRGLAAYLVVGDESDLMREIRAGRPVLVGLVQRYTSGRAYSHYEVVIGLNPERRRILLLDPGHGPREDGLDDFAHEWRDASRLTLVISPS